MYSASMSYSDKDTNETCAKIDPDIESLKQHNIQQSKKLDTICQQMEYILSTHDNDFDELKRQMQHLQRSISDIHSMRQPDQYNNHRTMHESHNYNSQIPDNRWTPGNTNTVIQWREESSKLHTIYDILFEKYKLYLDRSLVMSLILSTLSAFIAAIASALSINSAEYTWIIFCFNIIICLLSGTVTIISGMIKIYKWDELVSEINGYNSKLDTFCAEVSSQLILPEQLRISAVDFIKKEHDKYQNIQSDRPKISHSDFVKAEEEYYKYSDPDIQNNSDTDNEMMTSIRVDNETMYRGSPEQLYDRSPIRSSVQSPIRSSVQSPTHSPNSRYASKYSRIPDTIDY
jgi:hypothetical protein